ncbi:hypothetical protein [Micromonospora sp. CPCC 205561]|uniref:hypothetical protein n=1 Tax=Micromonospora sp. CPCC 205561 TaxID=3122407 RepID=UPI002FF17C56
MAGEERTEIRRWRPRRVWTLALLGAGVTLVALAFAVAAIVHSSDNPGSPSDQVEYQARIRASRSALFPGTLHVAAERRVRVGEESRIGIWACGPDSGVACPAGTATTGTGPVPDASREPVAVPLGARVRIDLAGGNPEAMTVRSVDAGGDPAQPLTERDDVAYWAWFVEATRPGTYPLVASVSVLAADSEALLMPRERVDIEITVTRTGAYTAREATRGGWAVTQWVVGTVIALLGTGLVTAATLARWRRRHRAAAGGSRRRSARVGRPDA